MDQVIKPQTMHDVKLCCQCKFHSGVLCKNEKSYKDSIVRDVGSCNEWRINPQYKPMELLQLLRSKRFDLHNEKILQGQMEEALKAKGITFQREVTLSPGNIIDFMSGHTGIEVKIAGSPKAIYKQLERYAQHEEVGEIILVTNKALALKEVNHKPVHIVNLGLAWL